ncbi:hypothetical protein ACQV4C_02435 [Streptomyces albidoflavus]|uniref:hypothetical protein n=1 Tax=Streptomyces TaxID=1883 RepID=UPI00190CA64F|nr:MULTISPECIES: hypothetical protein [unclassified Streptomyces]MBK3382160.1 hypothetical protein [Streptomyces sp. DEF147AK]MBK3386931.1 hypothetical protein [Streptomyces sp. DEF1AK]WSD56566.1 hypothetical protein OHA76_29150 [Streptomyces albidoflavus]WTC45222.1 hypothetical protein OH810_28465 [Streptomyces albidoflavus]
MDHGLPGDRTGALERGRAVGDVGGAQFPGAPPQQAAQLRVAHRLVHAHAAGHRVEDALEPERTAGPGAEPGSPLAERLLDARAAQAARVLRGCG